MSNENIIEKKRQNCNVPCLGLMNDPGFTFEFPPAGVVAGSDSPGLVLLNINRVGIILGVVSARY